MKTLKEIFAEKPTAEEKAWGIIYDFYHIVNVRMETENIKRIEIAEKMNVSRARVSQMFNDTPNNMTIKKMVEIADAVGLEVTLDIESAQLRVKPQEDLKKTVTDYHYEGYTGYLFIGDFMHSGNQLFQKIPSQDSEEPYYVPELPPIGDVTYS